MIGTLLNQRYLLQGEIGRGGMGIVYQARDTVLEREVAVKLVSTADLGTEGQARLLQEARAAASLNHPHIVAIHDAGEAETGPDEGRAAYIVMELVQGPSLRAYEPASLGDSLAMAWQICSALEAAHAKGIIHRDLKPENVLLSGRLASQSDLDQAPPLVKLMDFGLARVSGAGRLTRDGTLIGTLSYLAPELILGQPATPQSDLYAMGVLLYELLTGRPPFEGDSVAALLSNYLHAAVVPPSAYNEAVWPELDILALQLLEKNPDSRPSSAREVRELLAFYQAEALLASVRSGAPSSGPALSGPPHNLPAQTTAFIGRSRELGEATTLLESARLLTLTGPGGSGKTRLALELAAAQLPSFPDGVFFVSLASLRDLRLVAQTVANALEVKPAKGQRYLAALQDHLAHKQALLILDNYEHLLEAATVVSELLSAAGRLKVVATSREPLRLRGERRFLVPPLQLPAEGLGSREEVAQVEAIQLFVLRAQDADPDFQLTDDNLATVVAICRRLDGLPLALELAAARLSTYTPALLLERLSSRLGAPLRGLRDLPRRQQTLRNTIAWSYDLLDEGEQLLFTRLGVFAGRWRLADAEAVCGPGLPLDVADGLDSLADRNLLWLVEEQLGQPCYDMLGTIREYAVEQLRASGEESAIVERLARHMAALLPAALPPDPVGADRPVWFAFLALEIDNIRTALTYFLDHGEVQPAQQVMEAVVDYWDHRLVDEGSAWLDRLLDLVGEAPSAARGRALLQKGCLYLEGFDNRLAAALLEQSVQCYRTYGDQKGLFDALIQLGKAYHALGDYERRRQTFDEATAIAEALGDKSALCSALFLSTLGTTDSRKAGDTFLKCMALATEEGWLGRANVYKRLAAGCEIRLGKYDVGLAMLHECEAAERQMGRERDLAYVLFLLGEAEMRRGRLAEAGQILTEGLEIASGFADVDYPPYFFERFAPLAAAQGDYERAARLFGAAEAARELPSGWALNPEYRPAYEQDVAAVRAGLSEGAFAAAWGRGRAMSIAEATAYALRE